MSSNSRRKYLAEASKNPSLETTNLSPNVAKQTPIIFGFKNLDLSKKPFNCERKHADGLLYTYSIFQLFSKMIRDQLISYPNCHPVPDEQVKQHNLSNFLVLSPNSRLHQLGRGRTPERIVGYFDSPFTNLFQVCLLDLNHNLSGD